jgi:hypothetical protein
MTGPLCFLLVLCRYLLPIPLTVWQFLVHSGRAFVSHGSIIPSSSHGQGLCTTLRRQCS